MTWIFQGTLIYIKTFMQKEKTIFEEEQTISMWNIDELSALNRLQAEPRLNKIIIVPTAY